MVNVGADPVTVMSAPVKLPPGGVTMMSSLGALPVTAMVAAAGVSTDSVTSVGAVPVTVILAPAGVSVVVVAELRTTLPDAHALAILIVAPNVAVEVESLIARHAQFALGVFVMSVRFVPPVAELMDALVLPEK
jgi:hypothetical protein